ncbi:MAG: DUF503 domain-containing protein [Caldiserica bacterium]|nr:MAG: DUF503 domain-containing protein [Caldisericota bacterium]
MQIGICVVWLGIPGTFSLKAKRQICLSLFSRLRKNFNISITEIGHQNSYRKSIIAVVTVNTEKAHLYSTLSKIVEFIKKDCRLNIENYTTEVL